MEFKSFRNYFRKKFQLSFAVCCKIYTLFKGLKPKLLLFKVFCKINTLFKRLKPKRLLFKVCGKTSKIYAKKFKVFPTLNNPSQKNPPLEPFSWKSQWFWNFCVPDSAGSILKWWQQPSRQFPNTNYHLLDGLWTLNPPSRQCNTTRRQTTEAYWRNQKDFCRISTILEWFLEQTMRWDHRVWVNRRLERLKDPRIW